MEKEYGGKKTYLIPAFTLKLWTVFKNKQIEFSKTKIKFILPTTSQLHMAKGKYTE